jgi:hypothetical protein
LKAFLHITNCIFEIRSAHLKIGVCCHMVPVLRE